MLKLYTVGELVGPVQLIRIRAFSSGSLPVKSSDFVDMNERLQLVGCKGNLNGSLWVVPVLTYPAAGDRYSAVR